MGGIFDREVEGRTYVAPQYGKEITVKVGEDLESEDTAAVSEEAMEELGLRAGDIIEIYGAWMQEAKIVLSHEVEPTIIQMNKRIREKLPVDVGQNVGIRKKYTS
jgi:hypothetical protein